MTSFQNDGYEIIEDFLSADEVTSLIDVASAHELGAARGGVRNAERLFPAIHDLVTSPRALDTANKHLSGPARLVRVIMFDKTPENNWLVSWHQDKTIAVSHKADIDGWGPWTVKDGTHHVQPPLAVLNDMVTLRIHLDDATHQTGCLRVISGSHKLGILPAADIADYAATQSPVECAVKAGSVFIMRPHILHASSKATNPSHRRIIHAEYSSYDLPDGLAWV